MSKKKVGQGNRWRGLDLGDVKEETWTKQPLEGTGLDLGDVKEETWTRQPLEGTGLDLGDVKEETWTRQPLEGTGFGGCERRLGQGNRWRGLDLGDVKEETWTRQPLEGTGLGGCERRDLDKATVGGDWTWGMSKKKVGQGNRWSGLDLGDVKEES